MKGPSTRCHGLLDLLHRSHAATDEASRWKRAALWLSGNAAGSAMKGVNDTGSVPSLFQQPDGLVDRERGGFYWASRSNEDRIIDTHRPPAPVRTGSPPGSTRRRFATKSSGSRSVLRFRTSPRPAESCGAEDLGNALDVHRVGPEIACELPDSLAGLGCNEAEQCSLRCGELQVGKLGLPGSTVCPMRHAEKEPETLWGHLGGGV